MVLSGGTALHCVCKRQQKLCVVRSLCPSVCGGGERAIHELQEVHLTLMELRDAACRLLEQYDDSSQLLHLFIYLFCRDSQTFVPLKYKYLLLFFF